RLVGRQQLKRRSRAGQTGLRQMKVAHGRTDIAVAKQTLDGVNIDTSFQQVSGKGVAQGMNTTAEGNACGLACGMVNALGGLIVERAITGAIGKQPMPGTSDSPVQAKRFQKTR